MTAIEAYEQLGKLIKAGHGKRKFGFFSHDTGDFIQAGEIRPTVNGGYYEAPGKKKTEKVIQVVAGYFPEQRKR